MILLKEYKNILVNMYSCDDNELLRRKNVLEKNYSDEYLLKIIKDTYDFAKEVLLSDTIKKGYYKVQTNDNNYKYISLNILNGYNSDTIYIDFYNRFISKNLIKLIFGKQVSIEVQTEEFERPFEDDIWSYDIEHYIYMQGFNILNNNEIKLTKKI